MFKKTAVILVSGKISSGKTTSSNIMNKVFNKMGINSTTVSFALGLKRIARLMGWNGEKDEKGRKLLIGIGMTGREYDKDTWPKITFDLYLPEQDNYPYDVVLVDDWRFLNEGKYLEQNPIYKVYKVRIVGRGGDEKFSTDESECGLPTDPNFYDFILDNSGSMKDLEQLCSQLSNQIVKEMN